MVEPPRSRSKRGASAATPEQGGKWRRRTPEGRSGEDGLRGVGGRGSVRSGRSGHCALASGNDGPGPLGGVGGSPCGGSTVMRPSGRTKWWSGKWPGSPVRWARRGGRPSGNGQKEGTGPSGARARCQAGRGNAVPAGGEEESLGGKWRPGGGRRGRFSRSGQVRRSGKRDVRSSAGRTKVEGPRRAPGKAR
jgi:hypothetical protein